MPISAANNLADAVLEAVGLGICVMDSEGRVVRWNRTAADLTGISSGQIKSRIFREAVLFPGDLDKWDREIAGIIAGSPVVCFECGWRLGNGSVRNLVCRCSPVRDTSGALTHIVCAVMDGAPEVDALSRELMLDRMAEMRAISRFFHDTVSQDLVALSFEVSELEAMAADVGRKPDSVAAYIMDHCCRNVRLARFMMAPPSLADTALEDALRCYAAHLSSETGLAVEADIDSSPGALASEPRLLLFAAVQELATYWIRGARDARMGVRLRNTGAATILQLELVYPDSGFPSPGQPVTGWALIRARVHALGGRFELAGEPGRVFANISFPPAAQ